MSHTFDLLLLEFHSICTSNQIHVLDICSMATIFIVVYTYVNGPVVWIASELKLESNNVFFDFFYMKYEKCYIFELDVIVTMNSLLLSFFIFIYSKQECAASVVTNMCNKFSMRTVIEYRFHRYPFFLLLLVRRVSPSLLYLFIAGERCQHHVLNAQLYKNRIIHKQITNNSGHCDTSLLFGVDVARC